MFITQKNKIFFKVFRQLENFFWRSTNCLFILLPSRIKWKFQFDDFFFRHGVTFCHHSKGKSNVRTWRAKKNSYSRYYWNVDHNANELLPNSKKCHSWSGRIVINFFSFWNENADLIQMNFSIPPLIVWNKMKRISMSSQMLIKMLRRNIGVENSNVALKKI